MTENVRALHLTLLGTPTLTVGNAVHTLERHDAALLAYLALNGPLQRNRLATIIWPDVATRSAQTNLRQRLFRLKQRAGRDLVVSAGASLVLDPGITHDLDPREPGPHPARLLDPFAYDDCEELAAWLEQARGQLAQARLNRLTELAETLERAGHIAQALQHAGQIVAEAPVAEHGHRRLMRLHYRRGDRAAALAAFERCREALYQELGEPPGEETLQLMRLIDHSSGMAALPQMHAPVAILRPPRLVGREAEWQALATAAQTARFLLIRGEPGIGKSRLAAEFVATRAGSVQVQAAAGDALTPYTTASRIVRELAARSPGPLDDWVRAELARLVPEFGSPSQGKLVELRLQRAFIAAMAQLPAQGIGLVFLDDIQYADPASLGLLLAWLVERERPHVLATVREGEVPLGLQAWLEDQTDVVFELRLGPLCADDLALLIDSLEISRANGAQWAEALVRRTGGNPLFALELIREILARPELDHGAVAQASPAQVGRLLDKRLDRLSPDALHLAQIAALAGPDFTAELAAAVLGRHPLDLSKAWRELEQSQVLAGRAFVHDLIRDAALRSSGSSAEIAAAIHRRIARRLEADGAASMAPAARIAHHFREAQEWPHAARHFEAAAQAASIASRPREALEAWDAAARCHQLSGDAPAAFSALARTIEPAIVALPSHETAARVEALRRDARGDGQGLLAQLAHAQYAGTSCLYAEALLSSREAASLARALGDRKREYAAISIYGVCLTLTGQPAAALALFESMAEGLKSIGDPFIQSEFHSGLGHALTTVGRTQEAVDSFKTAAALAEVAAELDAVAVNLGNAAACLAQLGRPAEALAIARQAHELQLRLGDLRGEPFAISHMNLGILSLADGRFDQALAHFDSALALARQGGAAYLAAMLETHLANTCLRMGQPARAHQALTPTSAQSSARVLARRAVLAWRIRAYSSAVSCAPMLDALEAHGEVLGAIDRWGLELALAEAEPPLQACQRASRIRAEALQARHPGAALAAAVRLASALRRIGDLQAALRAAQDCVDEVERATPYDLGLAELWWTVHEVFKDAGQHDEEARSALQRGLAWVEHSLAHVPEHFVDAYLHRSPFVPRLRGAAARG